MICTFFCIFASIHGTEVETFKNKFIFLTGNRTLLYSRKIHIQKILLDPRNKCEMSFSWKDTEKTGSGKRLVKGQRRWLGLAIQTWYLGLLNISTCR
jgi:hypothetical protein